jgi:hypothetical protein
MSSAKNHKIRSHRSYRNKAAMLNNFQRTNYMKQTTKKTMQEKKSFFATLMGMFKKGEK